MLIDTETALVDDGEGNQIEVIIEEYATPSVNCTYKEHYLQREGYYMYGWDITSCSFGIY